MPQQVTLYHWPDSQLCAECELGQFVCLDNKLNLSYICIGNCEDNDGIECPEQH